MFYYVYILQSQQDGSYYKGFTTDLNKRLKEHNWHLSSYSSKKAPYTLVWYCAFKDKTRALDFERYFKSGSGFAFARKRLLN